MTDTGHVIVCGLEHLGLRTVDELRLRDEHVVAIGRTDEAYDHLTDLGVRLVVGDHRLPRTLRDADVATASAIVLTAEDDLGNLNTALAAAEINPEIRIVIRLFDQELGAHIPELFTDAVALSSSALAAPGFVSAAIDGETGSRFRLAGRIITSRRSSDPAVSPVSIPIARLHADRTVEMLPVKTAPDDDLVLIDVTEEGIAGADGSSPAKPDRSMSLTRWVDDLRGRLSRPERRLVRFATILVVLGIASAAYFYVFASLNPMDAVSYVVTLLTGASLPIDLAAASENGALRVYAILLSLVGAAIVAVVYAFITDALIRSRLLQTLGRRTVPSTIRDHVIVAGLGSIGYRIAQGLVARGVPVVVVEVSDEGRFVSPARAAGIPVFIGDARHPEVLDELRLPRARALVAATSDDLVNLSTALNARVIRPDLRVVLRLFDPDFAIRVQQGFGIRFTRSVSHLAAPAFAAAAIGSEVIATVPVGDRRIILFARLRVPPGSALEGRTAASLDAPGSLRVLAVADPGSEEARWDFPPDEIMDADEEIVVAATRAGLGELLYHASMVTDSVREVDARPASPDVASAGPGIAAVADVVSGAIGTGTKAASAAFGVVGSIGGAIAGSVSSATGALTASSKPEPEAAPPPEIIDRTELEPEP